MKRFTLADILDILFYTLSAGFVVFGVLRYFRLNVWLCLLFSLLIAAVTCLGTGLLLSSGRRKKVNSKREKEDRDSLLLHLALEKEERVRAELLTALVADERRANLKGDVLEEEGTLLIPLFTMEALSADTMAHLLKTYGEAPFTVVCNSVTPEAEKLLERFGKGIMAGDEVYSLFARTGTTPNPLICGQIPRRSVRTNFRRSFSKKNARPFFVSGLVLLAMSLFTLFPLYYLISGCILLVTAVLVRAVGFREPA